jgi:acyl-CoA dehydrogenase
MDLFLQEPPRLPSAWEGDRALRDALSFYLGDSFSDAEAILSELGRWATDPATLTKALRAENEPPTLKHYDAWGHRVDEVAVSDAYVELGKAGVERGVVALAYETEPFGELARLVWAATIYLWGPSSALYSCPIAMTDAAARTLLEHGDADDAEVAQRLVSRDPAFAWTSGQWMTETAGGSDVGRTATVARRVDGEWRLYGTKWFTSATTSEMALTLARPEGAPEGSRGLGLFRVHRMLDDGTPNAISVRRLKDKLGTRSMPTAELELEGALAYPVGDPLDGRGVAKISTMLNITRLHNALASAAALARGHSWATSFAETREVFGKKLADQPAHRVTLADLAVDQAAALALSFRCAQLMGRIEHSTATDEEVSVFRGLTPVAKLATARWAVAGAAEAMEALGGVGYCEDSGMPALVRNAHVLPIWEGTTNVLSLDLLRAAQRTDSFTALLSDCERAVSSAGRVAGMEQTVAAVRAAVDDLKKRFEDAASDLDRLQASARSIALGVASAYACALLCEQAAGLGANGAASAAAARRLAERGLTGPPPFADGVPEGL